MATARVAVVQAAPVMFDRERTIQKVQDLLADAARDGARLVLFPEAFVSGYPKGLDFGARVGLRTPAGRDDFRRYYDSAIDVPGPDCDALGTAARQAQAWLVIGVIERDGGTLYCTVLFFAPDGALLGKHRKLMPTAAERLIWGFGDGSTMPVLDLPVGRVGAVICWENYMPLLRAAMYAKNIQIWCAPTADDRETWLPTLRHIALEGRCFVLSACQFLTRSDCPEPYALTESIHPGDVLMRGGSSIIGPLGTILAGPCFDQAAILTAELDLAEITRGKYDFDATGHYARPDVFRLLVNESATPAVTFAAESAAPGDTSSRRRGAPG